MSAALSSAALAVLIGWAVMMLCGVVLSAPLALAAGAGAGAVAVTLFAHSLPVTGLMALLAPFGVMLPALALRHVAAQLGVTVQPFGTMELLIFLVLYTGFLAAAMGALPVDLYRYGYAPVPVALMVLAVCAYGYATGSLLLPLVAVLGQAVWVLGWGSSNWFDEVTHALLVPVLIIVLVQRLI